LACAGGHARAPAKSCTSRVYDSNRTSYCRVPTDPASPALIAGYVATCSAFYERGFGAPPHRFLCSLLQFYGLELHHLTPSGVLHIMAFVTLCEAYMGIEPHFNLWNYFSRVWLRPNSDVAAVVWGCTEIYVRTRPGIDPYFSLSVSNPFGWMAERVVLLEERRWSATPCGYG
jgi:hypothetical protein